MVPQEWQSVFERDERIALLVAGVTQKWGALADHPGDIPESLREEFREELLAACAEVVDEHESIGSSEFKGKSFDNLVDAAALIAMPPGD